MSKQNLSNFLQEESNFITSKLVFKGATIFGIMGSIVSVLIPGLFFGNQPLGFWIAGIFCFAGSLVTYYFFAKGANLKICSTILSTIAVFAYSLGVLSSGGQYSPIIVYGPSIVLVSALLGGYGSVSFPTITLVSLSLGMLLAESTKIYTFEEVASNDNPFLIGLQMATSIAFAGILSFLFVSMRKKTEFELKTLLEKLETEKQQLIKTETELRQSEIFLKAVLQNVPSMIFVKDFDKNLSFSLLNKTGQFLLGIDESALLGKNDYDFFPKEQADFFTVKDREVFSKGEVLKIPKEEISTPRGKRILKTLKVPTFDDSGRPKWLVGISDDITDEVNALDEKEIARSNSLKSAEQFQTIFHVSPHPNIIFGETGILDCNEAAVKIMGATSKSELLNSHPARFSPEYQPDGQSSAAKSLEMDRLAQLNGKHQFE